LAEQKENEPGEREKEKEKRKTALEGAEPPWNN